MGAGGGVRPGPLPQVPQGPQTPGLVPVIRIQKGDTGPPGVVQSHVPGLADAAVFFLVEHPDPVVCLGKFVADDRRAVGAAVVHQQQLPVGEGLLPHALHTIPQELLCLIDRHDDGNLWHRRPPCALRRSHADCGTGIPAPPQILGLSYGAIVPDFPGKVNGFSRKSRAY